MHWLASLVSQCGKETMQGTIIRVQDILEKDVGFWRVEGFAPRPGDILILGGDDWEVRRIIWDGDPQDGAPYAEMRPRILAAQLKANNVLTVSGGRKGTNA
jgi:hypothetical protein